MQNRIWPKITLTDDQLFRHRIGPLSIFLKKSADEVWVASSRDDNRDGDPEELPEKPEWMRIALPITFQEFQISPVLPNLPVVIDTDFIYRFFSQTRTRVYTRIPAFARITPAARPDLVIAELPTVILSETWFGIFTEGELSYALSSSVRKAITKDLYEPHLIICPIQIWNKSDQELKFEKVCLRVARLSVFASRDALWSDETLITYHGTEIDSDIEMQGMLPAEAGKGELVSSPRIQIKRSIGLRTFKFLRDFHLPGF